jgi:ABC exporter DevB family membrane fusion protein
MRSVAVFLAGALSMGVASMIVPRLRPESVQQAAREPSAPSVVLAAEGRIEGRSVATEVGPAMTGVVHSVAVSEGQHVAAGTVLAEVQCGDLRAETAAASASEMSLRQERTRLLRGSRNEERRIAAGQVAAARADLDEARTRLGRMRVLVEKDDISRAQFDEVERQFRTAEARWQQAVSQQELANAGPLPEDLAKIDQQIAAAAAHAASLEEQTTKCAVRAPFSGTVLRVHVRAGETVSTVFPRALFTMSDTSRLRVRAEVDERDIGRVRNGQRVEVTAAGIAGALSGAVTAISPMMGRRTVLSGDPAEKTDRDTLEVVADLDPSAARPAIGLRVTVRFRP